MIRRGLRNRRIAAVLMAAAMMMTVFSGCSSSNSDSDTKEQGEGEEGGIEGSRGAESVDSEMELTQSEVDTEFTDRDKDGSYSEKGAAFIQLNGSSAKAEGSNVKVSENTVVISGEGTYVISGTMEDGQILVEAEDTDKIQIVLNGAQIHCETSAAIYIKQADKVFLTLADGTENRLSGGTEYVDTDENTVDAVVFSKEDLAVNGSGSLWIDADYKHGIVSKDDLVVTGGSLTIDAEKQCMSGKDSVKILDGTFHLTGRGKAVKSENTEESTLGNLYVAGGNFTIDTEDDAFHAGGSILVDGGTFAIKTGDDGFHADVDTVMNGGELQITECYEGLEGYRVVINGGSIAITASDDGINAAAPNDDSETMDAVNDERTSEPPRMPEGREMEKCRTEESTRECGEMEKCRMEENTRECGGMEKCRMEVNVRKCRLTVKKVGKVDLVVRWAEGEWKMIPMPILRLPGERLPLTRRGTGWIPMEVCLYQEVLRTLVVLSAEETALWTTTAKLVSAEGR